MERGDQLQPGTAVVMGFPFDEYSSFMRGPALAPPLIREALNSDSTNLCSEDGNDLGVDSRFRDMGDLNLENGMAAFRQMEGAVDGLLKQGIKLVSLGGDHAITYPIVKAFNKHYDGLNILHLDAHPDLYDNFEGNRYSHACPFSRIMEEGLASRLVQVGIRTMNPHQQEQARRFNVEVKDMMHWGPGLALSFEGPVYLSLDMDVLDPAFAPGVSHLEPGGLSTREVIGLIQDLEGTLVGADIVEFNPRRDPTGITAMAAAKCLKEIVACMLKKAL